MATKPLTIRVDMEAARTYETASDEQQRKLDALLSLKLVEVTQAQRSLEDIMTDMNRHAQARGLTPERLESMLNEP